MSATLRSSSVKSRPPLRAPLLAGLLAGLVGLTAPGCGQGEGERCEINADCNVGTCVPIGTRGNEGVCREDDTPVTPVPDAAVPGGNQPDALASDTAARDVLPDAGGDVRPDAGPIDSAAADVVVDAVTHAHE